MTGAARSPTARSRSRSRRLSARPPPAATPASAAPVAPRCGDPTVSLRPPATIPQPDGCPRSRYMRTIQSSAGRLIVGVDQNTLRFGYRQSVHRAARGLRDRPAARGRHGPAGRPGRDPVQGAHLGSTRFDAVRERRVDIVASAATITCARRRQVAFTVAVLRGRPAPARPVRLARSRGFRDLAGKQVCATVGSTSIKNLRAANPARSRTARSPSAPTVSSRSSGASWTRSPATTRSCSASRRRIPYTEDRRRRASRRSRTGWRSTARILSSSRFVNGVLARMRADGTWSTLNDRWLGELAQRPPAARYGDEP